MFDWLATPEELEKGYIDEDIEYKLNMNWLENRQHIYIILKNKYF